VVVLDASTLALVGEDKPLEGENTQKHQNKQFSILREIFLKIKTFW